METPRLYKWLKTDGSCIWGEGAWKLPKTKDRGARPMPRLRGRLEVCTYGYHAFEAGDLKNLLPGCDAMLVEVHLLGAAKLDGKWVGYGGRVLRVVFATDALAEYRRVVDQAEIEYRRVVDQAEIEHNRATAQALAEYRRATAQALAEYNRAPAQALAEYRRVFDQALAEYHRVFDQALIEYRLAVDAALAVVA